MYRSFCCTSDYNRKKQSTESTTGELLAEKVVRACCFALLWLGNFKTSGCLVGRLACAAATTRLTHQLVGISTITYDLSPYTFSGYLQQKNLIGDSAAYLVHSTTPVSPTTTSPLQTRHHRSFWWRISWKTLQIGLSRHLLSMTKFIFNLYSHTATNYQTSTLHFGGSRQTKIDALRRHKFNSLIVAKTDLANSAD